MPGREEIQKQPSWDERFRDWAFKFIKANKWRCSSFYSFEDLMQDAYITFRRVLASYPRVTDERNLMALYKVAMFNEMMDKARSKQKFNENSMVELEHALDVFSYTNEGPLKVLLNKLPVEAQLLFEVLNDPKKLKELNSNRRGIRENLNMKLCRILGIKLVDIIGPLRCVLTNGDKDE